MIRLMFKRLHLLYCLKKYGNPHKHSLFLIMFGTWPVCFKDGCVFFTFEGDGTAYLHSAAKRITKHKINRSLEYLRKEGVRTVAVYQDNSVINGLCELYGARLENNKYTMEI